MGAPPAGASYGYAVGGIFIFNLIVGTGALALPSGFSQGGVILSTITTLIVAFLAYIGVTFIVECTSHATLITRLKESKEKSTARKLDENTTLLGDSATLSLQAYEEGTLPNEDVNAIGYGMDQFELGAMSELFLGDVGKYLFYGILLLYLYGDLAIYAVAVPQSLQNTLVTSDEGVNVFGFNITPYVAYLFFLFAYACFALPFCFFNFSNTKYLQFFTIFYRNLAFWTMIILAFVAIGEDPPPLDQIDYISWKGLPTLWGTVIYCFMCHHSVPGLIAPLQDKKRVNLLMAGVYTILFLFYSLLSCSAMFGFDQYAGIPCEGTNGTYPCGIDSLYTYNFIHYSHRFVSYYLTLFPVFTITTNYPLIAITLRNNMLHLIPWGTGKSWESYRVYVFSAIAAVPSFLLAIVFQQVDVLVSLTGSYAGLGIEFIIPAVLIYVSRKAVQRHFPGAKSSENPYASPFQHVLYIWLILGVAALTLIIVTLNNIYDLVQYIEGDSD